MLRGLGEPTLLGAEMLVGLVHFSLIPTQSLSQRNAKKFTNARLVAARYQNLVRYGGRASFRYAGGISCESSLKASADPAVADRPLHERKTSRATSLLRSLLKGSTSKSIFGSVGKFRLNFFCPQLTSSTISTLYLREILKVTNPGIAGSIKPEVDQFSHI